MATTETVQIPLEQLIPADLKIRDAKVDSDKYEALKANIAQLGVQTPLVIRNKKDENDKIVEDQYEIVNGCQRHGIAHDLGLLTLPCVINNDLTDDDAQILQFSLNEFTVQNTTMEKVAHFKTFMLRHPEMSKRELATTFGMSEAALSQLLGLSRLSDEAVQAVNDGSLAMSKAIALSRIPKEYQGHMLTTDMKNLDSTQYIARAQAHAKECKKGEPKKAAKDLLVPVPRSKSELLGLLDIAQADLEATAPDHENYPHISGRFSMIQEVLQIDPQSQAKKAEIKEIRRKRAEVSKLEKKLKAEKEMREQLEKQKAELQALTS